jgi:hypothetical protein
MERSCSCLATLSQIPRSTWRCRRRSLPSSCTRSPAPPSTADCRTSSGFLGNRLWLWFPQAAGSPTLESAVGRSALAEGSKRSRQPRKTAFPLPQALSVHARVPMQRLARQQRWRRDRLPVHPARTNGHARGRVSGGWTCWVLPGRLGYEGSVRTCTCCWWRRGQSPEIRLPQNSTPPTRQKSSSLLAEDTIKVGELVWNCLTLLAGYVYLWSIAISHVTLHQLDSLYTAGCCGGSPTWSIAAEEDVTTTRLTDGACSLIDRNIPVVPLMAGSRQSCTGSLKCSLYGDAVWTT